MKFQSNSVNAIMKRETIECIEGTETAEVAFSSEKLYNR